MVMVGDDVSLTCTVELNSGIQPQESDLSLLMVSAQLTHPNGTMLSLSNTLRGTTFTYTTQLNSFRRSDSGNYTCTANIEPQLTATFLTGIDDSMLPSDVLEATTGKIVLKYIVVISLYINKYFRCLFFFRCLTIHR
jgi:hypothetical protein